MSLQKKTKDIEHTLNKPLVVAIEQLSTGEWTIQPQSDFRNETVVRFISKMRLGLNSPVTCRELFDSDNQWLVQRVFYIFGDRKSVV